MQLGKDREDGPGSETLKEEVGRSWGEIERMAQDRRCWRTVVGGLCPGVTRPNVENE